MLRPDALVVRGGIQRDPEKLVSKIRTQIERGEEPDVSVWAHNPKPGESRAQTILRIVEEAEVPHPKVQVASHQEMIDAGLTLILDTSNGQAGCHYNVTLGLQVDTEKAGAFISCFAEPEPKPTRGN